MAPAGMVQHCLYSLRHFTFVAPAVMVCKMLSKESMTMWSKVTESPTAILNFSLYLLNNTTVDVEEGGKHISVVIRLRTRSQRRGLITKL